MEVNQAMQIVEKTGDIVKQAPDILKSNRLVSDKVVSVGQKILAEIGENGMDERLDKICDDYLKKCTVRISELKEAREPVTQMMGIITAQLTELEKNIDKAKPGTVAYQIKIARDNYAAEKLRKQKEDEARLKREADKKLEAVDIRVSMEQNLRKQINDHISRKKEIFLRHFNAITLDIYDEKAKAINTLEPVFDYQLSGPYCTRCDFHTDEERIAIAQEVVNNLWPEITATFNKEIGAQIAELRTLLPSKKKELLDQKEAEEAAAKAKAEAEEAEAKAKAAKSAKAKQEAEEAAAKAKAEAEEAEKQKKQLQEQQEKREAEEAEKIKAQQLQADKNAEQKAEVDKVGAEAMVMFNQTAQAAEIATAGKVKTKLEIIIHHQSAWVQIFQFWYQRAGEKMALNKMEAVKLETMKKFAEKTATDGGEKIDSKLLTYEEKVEAVTSRNKKENA